MEKYTRKNKKEKRYTPIEKGIRFDNILKKYNVYKRIKGVYCDTYLDNIRECRLWRQTYVPSELKNPITKDFDPDNNALITFDEAWDIYKKNYLASDVAVATYNYKMKRERIFKYLMLFRMRNITPKVITEFIRFEKEKWNEDTPKNRRCNFNHELKVLKAFFNWWKEESEDTHFQNPVLNKHRKIGIICETPYREKKMDRTELLQFFNALGEKTLWQDLAYFQFYIAGRIQEAAAIQVERIDLRRKELLIKEVAVWGDNKKLLMIKSLPKNNKPEPVFLNDTLLEIAIRRIECASPIEFKGQVYNLIFNIDGKPLSYRQIQYHYNKALQKCGLHKKFSGTHIMRHSMGTITRSVTGNLDSAQAVTRHKDTKIAQQYSQLDYELQKKASNDVEDYMSCTTLDEKGQSPVPKLRLL